MHLRQIRQLGGILQQIKDNDPPLHSAAYNGDVDSLKHLLDVPGQKEHINDRNRLGCTPIRLAATGLCCYIFSQIHYF